MCTGLEPALIAAVAGGVGAGVSALSAIQQGNQAEAMGDYQRRQAEADASVQASEAQLQARQIRKAGDKQRASARASLAGAGVALGTGTAELIDKDINANSETDALLSIYQGETRADQIRAGGNVAALRGQNAKTAGYLNAGASVLNGVGSVSRAWGSRPASARA